MHGNKHQILVVLGFFLLFYFHNISSISVKVLKKSEAHNHSSHRVEDKHKHEAGVCNSPHYGENPDTTKALVAIEEELVEYVQHFISQNDKKETSKECYWHLSKYLKEYDEDTLAVEKDKEKLGLQYANRSDIVAENPIFALKMVRRIANILMRDALKECKLSLKYINDIFKNEGLRPPSSEDVPELYGGIMAITYIYQVNTTNEPRYGPFNATTAQLKFEDFMALANRSLDLTLKQDNNGVISYHWLNAASNELLREGELADLHDKRMLEEGWTRLVFKKGLSTIKELHDTLRKQWQNQWKYSDREHENLCRGESDNIPPRQLPKKLVCFFQFDFLISYKVEIISTDPPIIYYHQFLTDKEIQFIRYESPVKLVEPVMFTKRDTFGSEDEYLAALGDKLFQVTEEKNHELVVQSLARKVEDTTRLVVSEEYMSAYEYSLYSPLSHIYDAEKIRGTQTVYNAYRDKKPLGTYLMFQTDVRMGGHVIFPDLNVYVKPERGSTLFFYNLDDQWRMDRRLYHANCPVVLGIKEVANLPLHLPSNGIVEDLFPWRVWQ